MGAYSSSLLPKISPDDDRQSDQPLSSCILKLFESQILTDVTFRCKDQDIEDQNERIHSHKNILAARSPVFRAMFSGPYTDGEKEIYLSDIDSKDFKAFLRSIYSDELPSEVGNLVQAVKIAHKYQINYVVDSCFTKLSESLTTENACSLLDLALFYGNEKLTTSACRFIDKNSEGILESEGFLEVSLQCLTSILKGDTFFTNEFKIFQRSMEWAERRCESSEGSILRTTLGEAFLYLRTPVMTMKEFISCTKRKGYYTLTETEDIMEAIANNDDSECDNVLCNSRTTRVPLQIDVQISERQHSVSQYTYMYVSQAFTVLILVPKIDIILTSIKLSDLRKGRVRNPYSRYGPTHEHYNVDGRQFKATVTIEEKGIFQEYFVTVKAKPITIILKSPIFLGCSEDKYFIRIELQPINMSFIEFEVLPLYANSLKDVTDDFGTITIRCDSKSRCDSIVDSLTFQHLSHRED